MSFKPWEYKGYYFDNDIGLYINETTGFGATMKYMESDYSHLRIK